MKDFFLLDPNIIFLNHGSFGASPKPVFETYQTWQRKLEEQPVLFLGRSYHELLQTAKEPLAAYLGTFHQNLLFVPNATYGVNLIARSLDLQPGDEILTSNHEYGACDYTWQFLTAKSGARYIHRAIPFPSQTDQEIVKNFWQGVTPNTKLIYLSHITSPTALRLPVEEIIRRAREAGILTLIDGAHAPGQIPLDLDTLQADFYTGNLHKWLMAPKGAAFLYAHPRVQHLVEPLVVSWGLKTEPQFSSGSPFIDRLTWTGTHDPSAYLSVPAAIQFQQEYNWPEVQAACHQQLKKYLPEFSTLTGKPVLNAQDHQYGQMAAIELPLVRDLLAFKTELYDQYRIEIPHILWENRHFLRISYQVYNQPEDLTRLVDVLKVRLPHWVNR
jgi:isopenicillin-N epimerase